MQIFVVSACLLTDLYIGSTGVQNVVNMCVHKNNTKVQTKVWEYYLATRMQEYNSVSKQKSRNKVISRNVLGCANEWKFAL